MNKLCTVQTSSRASTDNAVIQILCGLVISFLACSVGTVIYSSCLVSEQNCRTTAVWSLAISCHSLYGKIPRLGDLSKVMEDVARVHVDSVLLHVPLIWVIINTGTQILNGIDILPVKDNKHKLGFARALCWGDFRLLSSIEKVKLRDFKINLVLMW